MHSCLPIFIPTANAASACGGVYDSLGLCQNTMGQIPIASQTALHTGFVTGRKLIICKNRDRTASYYEYDLNYILYYYKFFVSISCINIIIETLSKCNTFLHKTKCIRYRSRSEQ